MPDIADSHIQRSGCPADDDLSVIQLYLGPQHPNKRTSRQPDGRQHAANIQGPGSRPKGFAGRAGIPAK
ncbi:hypothetical protein MmonteBS_12610 [Mycobacterium montefiorense]|uniref:Uncharacterized protein n=1 Tax=Mycobacterium montefiorense TaxID=154654 RepID=A0AA37UWT1_9MYCO|nr:hypothetical protein MmonteBS_12610 [Mycobacterium montefiorense]GKU42754.1 hypothetical protein NJB14192_47370 [Mycobacterium montefiorense]GKU46369.1 hypothetical protein NJB14194_29890 [Mycobacterium montefiorense]GKU51047.1 hypothetical protein NJB14195_22930 [Mycobacterium montefiorense]GKU64208.1 hypothetical protein NJB18182_47080 [Mycobacterium montefiorense]